MPARVDRELLREAAARQAAGEPLNREHRAALRRFEREQQEKHQRDTLERCPKQLYLEATGRQTKILHEQAERYGLPLRGRTINLGDVLRRFHDLLAEHGHKLQTAGLPPDLLDDSPALERKRAAEADLKELDLAERRRELIHRDTLRGHLAQTAALLRRAGETLGRRHGAAAQAILDEALDEAERRIDAATRPADE